MYTSGHTNRDDSPEVPHGYAGSAFSDMRHEPPTQDVNHNEEAIPTGGRHTHRKHAHGHRSPGWLSLFSGGRFPGLDFRSFLSGDLLLIAVALLLVAGDKDDGCEAEDNDLWLLLLLLYFMK